MRRAPLFATLAALAVLALDRPAEAEPPKTCGTHEAALKKVFDQWTTESQGRGCGGLRCLANARDRLELGKAMSRFFAQALTSEFPRLGLRAIPVASASVGNVVLGSTQTYVTTLPLDFDEAELVVTKQGGGAALVTLAFYDGSKCLGTQTLDFESQDTAGRKLRVKQKGALGSLAVVRVDARGTSSFDYKLELAKAAPIASAK